MVYKIGSVGLGHWVLRLCQVLQNRKDVILINTVGTRAFDDKVESLKACGITEDQYYKINPSQPLPDDFLGYADIVYIASPNQFHKYQTIQALENEKVVVIEKTFATNRKDFEEIVDLIRGKYENKATVHLHYLSKALTLEFRKIFPELIEKYGKIESISATFFEKKSLSDSRRAWLFKPENGGIFLDWVHPIEIMKDVVRAELDLSDAKTFIVQPEYDDVNPTAVQVVYNLRGKNFTQDSKAVIRVGKGFQLEHKVMRLKFEKAVVDLNYLSTEEEFTTGLRGEIRIVSDGKVKTIIPEGVLSYDVLVDEMVRMAKGGKPTLSLDEIVKIYEPEWEFQDKTKNLQPIRKIEEIQEFIKAGLENRI